MDQNNKQPFNPKAPVSSILQQEVEGYIPLEMQGKVGQNATPAVSKLPSQQKKDESRIIKTFESDVARVLKEKNGSVVKIAVKEQERKDAVKAAQRQPDLAVPHPPVQQPIQKPIQPPVNVNIQQTIPAKIVAAPRPAPAPVQPLPQPVPPPQPQVQPAQPIATVQQPQPVIRKPVPVAASLYTEDEMTYQEPKKKHTGLIVTSVILLLVGAAAIPTVQYFLKQKTAEVPVVTEKSILPFDKKQTFDITGATHDAFVTKAHQAIAAGASAGNLNNVTFTLQETDENQKTQTVVANTQAFVKAAAPSMPSSLTRSLDPQFMFGTYGESQMSSPFIIFTTESYDQTFAGMLRYEDSMADELGEVFNIPVSTSTPKFVDKIIQNKDVRALTDAKGSIIFLYGFVDNHTLLITTTPTTFKEISSRFVSAHFVQ